MLLQDDNVEEDGRGKLIVHIFEYIDLPYA
jgi:hypothetical protein